MRKEKYKSWLIQVRKYQHNAAENQLSKAVKVDEIYGDLDNHYDDDHDNDRLGGIIRKLSYSKNDERNDLPNPSEIPINGNVFNGLASYKGAVKRYKEFRDEEGASESTTQEVHSSLGKVNDGQKIGLERDMQAALRVTIEQLEEGLVIIDDGIEKSVDSGFIDITAKDSKGAVVVIELKTGMASQKAIAQILSYMGDVIDEYDKTGTEVRGILVAFGFDSKSIAASKAIPSLQLKKYNVRFTFEDSTG